MIGKSNSNGLAPFKNGAVTGVKGNAETSYRTGNINITPANIGLGNVDNTKDSDKRVSYAESAGSCEKATQDASGNVITSTYATKTALDGKVGSDGVLLNIQKVTALPSSPDANTLYVVIES